MPTPEITAARSARHPPASLTLDGLARLGVAELEQAFAMGRSPDQLTAIEGAPRGRVLAAPAVRWRAVAPWWRRLASSRLMLWEGKSFEAGPGGTSGRGANRVRLVGRRAMFPFATSLGASIVDGLPCVAIDYDVRGNPRAARGAYDELREVAPGLFLGRGTLRIRGRRRLAVWFAVDATAFDKPIALPPR